MRKPFGVGGAIRKGAGSAGTCVQMEEDGEPWELKFLKAYCGTDLSLDKVCGERCCTCDINLH